MRTDIYDIINGCSKVATSTAIIFPNSIRIHRYFAKSMTLYYFHIFPIIHSDEMNGDRIKLFHCMEEPKKTFLDLRSTLRF